VGVEARILLDDAAVEPEQPLQLPGGEVRALLARHPDVALAILGHLGGLVGALSDEVEQQREQSIAERVALKLSQLGRGRREVRVTHQALADQVGASRENVSRALKALERRGLVRLRRGRIELLGP
jgi:CRP-like cAMP-binding protein